MSKKNNKNNKKNNAKSDNNKKSNDKFLLGAKITNTLSLVLGVATVILLILKLIKLITISWLLVFVPAILAFAVGIGWAVFVMLHSKFKK